MNYLKKKNYNKITNYAVLNHLHFFTIYGKVTYKLKVSQY